MKMMKKRRKKEVKNYREKDANRNGRTHVRTDIARRLSNRMARALMLRKNRLNEMIQTPLLEFPGFFSWYCSSSANLKTVNSNLLNPLPAIIIRSYTIIWSCQELCVVVAYVPLLFFWFFLFIFSLRLPSFSRLQYAKPPFNRDRLESNSYLLLLRTFWSIFTVYQQSTVICTNTPILD